MSFHLEDSMSLNDVEESLISAISGKQLWGDLYFPQDYYEKIRSLILAYMQNHYISISSMCWRFPVTLTTFMVFLARYKFDNNFWGLLGKELKSHIDGPTETEIGASVRSTFRKYGFDFSDVSSERRVNLEPILYEAGLPPESTLDDLFYILNYDAHNVFDPQLIIDDLVDMRSYQIRKPLLKFLNRFKGDRALEFVTEIHEAMLSVDQSMASDSHYVGNYTDWKEKDTKKETAAKRKNQETQTRPYLFFDNSIKGLCLILPRIIMKNEWVEDAEWIITSDNGLAIRKPVMVLGDEGKRYIDSISVPVCPAAKYKVSLIDNENLDDKQLEPWDISGIADEGIIFFNADGRMINASYLPLPYAIAIYGSRAKVIDSSNILITQRYYPTNRPDYTIISIEPTGVNASLKCLSGSKTFMLGTRPQINMEFYGKTLFSLPITSTQHIFTEIPRIEIRVDEWAPIDEYEVRVGKYRIPINHLFAQGCAIVELDKLDSEICAHYGIYSIRLYHGDHFLKQAEFAFVPNIGTDYTPYLDWPKELSAKKSRFKFEKNANWQLEFSECIISNSKDYYIVDCPANVGAIEVKLKSLDESNAYSCSFELPIRPFEVDIIDGNGTKIEKSLKMIKLGLSDIQNEEYWISLRLFGDYADYGYTLQLRSVNGVEQMETLSLNQSKCCNFNLSSFNDTMNACPLPARFELHCENGEVFPLLCIVDNVQLLKRPVYLPQRHLLVVDAQDGEKDLIITRFGLDSTTQHLYHHDSRINKDGTCRGFECNPELKEGLYIVEQYNDQSGFEFENDNVAIVTSNKNTIFVSLRSKDSMVEKFADWLDQLMRDIIKAGATKDFSDSPSFEHLNRIGELKETPITDSDCEKIVSLVYFRLSKCSKEKKRTIELCMHAISQYALNSLDRLKILQTLIQMQCPQDVFDYSLKAYCLYLFEPGATDAIKLSEMVEPYSVELSMLLKMGAGGPIRDTLWRDKYIEIIGKESIKSLLSVPNAGNASVVAEEQKKFLREQGKSLVRISISPEISGEMEPIRQNMIKVTYNKIYFDKSKKPDIGIYFDHIRYVDQYVNWYSSHISKDGDILPETKAAINHVVMRYCENIMLSFRELKDKTDLSRRITQYERALQSRFNGDPESSIKVCIPARYFYLQGLAAFLARIPAEYRGYGWAIRAGEGFMIEAIEISPRIARRDLMMADTYLYLTGKEEKLCR